MKAFIIQYIFNISYSVIFYSQLIILSYPYVDNAPVIKLIPQILGMYLSSVYSLLISRISATSLNVTCRIYVLYKFQFCRGYFLHTQYNIYSNAEPFITYSLSYFMDFTYFCIDILFISNVNVFGVYQNLRKVFINSIQFILPAYIKFVNMISFLIIWKYVTSFIINSSIALKVKSYPQVTQELSAFLFFDTLFYNILYVYQTLNSSISVLWTSSRCIRGTFVNVCCISSKILFYF